MLKSGFTVWISNLLYARSCFVLYDHNSAQRYMIRKQMNKIALGLNLPSRIKETIKKK